MKISKIAQFRTFWGHFIRLFNPLSLIHYFLLLLWFLNGKWFAGIFRDILMRKIYCPGWGSNPRPQNDNSRKILSKCALSDLKLPKLCLVATFLRLFEHTRLYVHPINKIHIIKPIQNWHSGNCQTQFLNSFLIFYV